MSCLRDIEKEQTEVSLWCRRLILIEVTNVRRVEEHFVVANVTVSLQTDNTTELVSNHHIQSSILDCEVQS